MILIFECMDIVNRFGHLHLMYNRCLQMIFFRKQIVEFLLILLMRWNPLRLNFLQVRYINILCLWSCELQLWNLNYLTRLDTFFILSFVFFIKTLFIVVVFGRIFIILIIVRYTYRLFRL